MVYKFHYFIYDFIKNTLFENKFVIKKECLYVDEIGMIKKGKQYPITYAIELKDVEELYEKTIEILTK